VRYEARLEEWVRGWQPPLGRSMAEEIARLRLERAVRLLVESNERIKQLASNCGFNSVNHFNRVFLQRYGIAPLEYRRRHRASSARHGSSGTGQQL